MDKKFEITVKNKERFLRSFGKRVDESSLLLRFGIGGDRAFVGRCTGRGVVFFRKRVGIFSLFALTARGTFHRRGGEDFLSLRFGRCLPLTVLWLLWCGLMVLAGVLLLGSSPLFALYFLVPALLSLLPLVWFSGKEKARLFDFVSEIACLRE